MHKKYIDFDIYVLFRNNIIDITENFIIEKYKIEQKEKESFGYEQKFRDLKNRLHDRSFKESRRLDKKYNNKFDNLFTYYQKFTEKYYSDLKKERKMLFNVSTVNIVYVEIYVFVMKI